MDKRKIRSVLQDAMEEEIPSSQVNLWPAVKADLVAGKHQLSQQGAKMKAIESQRIPRLAFALLIILALLVLTFATPQGRSFAQNLLQFFTRVEGTTIPIETSQVLSSEPDPSEPTAQPPAPLISVAEAEAKAGFEAAVLPFVPEGYNFLGARLYGDNISIEYQVQDGWGNLIIMQSQDGFYQSNWDAVPADTILPVKIGDLDGEFTQGTFVVYAGETVGRWNPEAPILRLRWVKDGVWFQMTKYGDAKSVEYLDQAGLVKLAESLANNP